MRIISTSKVQKNIAILSDNTNIYTVINKGEPKTMIIPYFEGLQEIVENYLEDMEISLNKESLSTKYQNSKNSGLSDLII
ncbi:MAG: hypothetical protein Q9M94_02375 [Candidatus Gracilibacteria bacterium]|nr:hypothetical protein [Candidatus Gracilibacteria bacterium]